MPGKWWGCGVAPPHDALSGQNLPVANEMASDRMFDGVNHALDSLEVVQFRAFNVSSGLRLSAYGRIQRRSQRHCSSL
eukprot:7042112-Prymnesium_polylepis.1